MLCVILYPLQAAALCSVVADVLQTHCSSLDVAVVIGGDFNSLAEKRVSDDYDRVRRNLAGIRPCKRCDAIRDLNTGCLGIAFTGCSLCECGEAYGPFRRLQTHLAKPDKQRVTCVSQCASHGTINPRLHPVNSNMCLLWHSALVGGSVTDSVRVIDPQHRVAELAHHQRANVVSEEEAW